MYFSHSIRIAAAEIRNFLRDRNIVIYSVLMPIFLYPLTFWIMNQVMLLQQGWSDQEVPVVSIANASAAPDLMQILEGPGDLTVVTELLDRQEGPAARISLDDGVPDQNGDRCLSVTVSYDRTNDLSDVAHKRILAAIEKFRHYRMSMKLSSVGYDPDSLRLPIIESVNIDTQAQTGAFIVGMMMPMMIIIMAAMGTLYPAIDVTVGERERKTLETTLLLPVSRPAIISGKFVAIVLAGCAAVFLNMLSLGLTAKHTIFLLEEEGGALFTIPTQAYPLLVLTTVIISAGFGAASMFIASFAGTFREAQSYVTPFFIISFQPAIIAALPGIEFSWLLSFIPITNAALMFRDIINGSYDWAKIAVTLFSLMIMSITMLLVTSHRLRQEHVNFRIQKDNDSTRKKTFFSWSRS